MNSVIHKGLLFQVMATVEDLHYCGNQNQRLRFESFLDGSLMLLLTVITMVMCDV